MRGGAPKSKGGAPLRPRPCIGLGRLEVPCRGAFSHPAERCTISRPMKRLAPPARPPSSVRRAWAHTRLSRHPLGFRWALVPACAELLGLCGRGDRAARALGRRLDEPCARLSMPAGGHERLRPAAAADARERRRAASLALRPVARPAALRGGRAGFPVARTGALSQTRMRTGTHFDAGVFDTLSWCERLMSEFISG